MFPGKDIFKKNFNHGYINVNLKINCENFTKKKLTYVYWGIYDRWKKQFYAKS